MKRNVIQIVALILVGILCAALFASCGGDKKPEDPTAAPTEEQTGGADVETLTPSEGSGEVTGDAGTTTEEERTRPRPTVLTTAPPETYTEPETDEPLVPVEKDAVQIATDSGSWNDPVDLN